VAVRITSEKRRPEAKSRDTEVHYYVVTGLSGQRRLGAKRLAKIIRQHWGIENRLHHVLDRTLREDDQKVRSKDGPLILSLLRKVAISAMNQLVPQTLKGKYLPEKQATLRDKPNKLIKLLNRKIS
jgi:predicted transposase YbfD/YdcC